MVTAVRSQCQQRRQMSILFLTLLLCVFATGVHGLIDFLVPSSLAPKYLYKDSLLVNEIDLKALKDLAPKNVGHKLQHRPTIIVFYAPWCPHCRKFVPKYNEIAAKFQDPSSSLDLFDNSKLSKSVQFLAVNCVDQAEACNYISLCSNDRKLSTPTKEKEKAKSAASYGMDGCGYPTILAFNFDKDEDSTKQWFGHHISHSPKDLEQYIAAFSNRPHNPQEQQQQLQLQTSSADVAGRSAEMQELVKFMENTRGSLARVGHTAGTGAGTTHREASERAPVYRLQDGLASVNYMLLVTVPSQSYSDELGKDHFLSMMESVDQFLSVLVPLLPWELTSKYFGLVQNVAEWEGKQGYIKVREWIKPLLAAVNAGKQTVDLIALLKPNATPAELLTLGSDPAAQFGALWKENIARLLQVDPANIEWKLCGRVANLSRNKGAAAATGSSNERLQGDVDTRTEGHTCGLWLLFHYMSVASEMSTLGLDEKAVRIPVGIPGLSSSSNSNSHSVRVHNNFSSAVTSAVTITSADVSNAVAAVTVVGALDVMEALHVFMQTLFSCGECQGHFLRAYDARSHGRGEVVAQSDYRPLQLWLLRFHNAVTLRILDGYMNPLLSSEELGSQQHTIGDVDTNANANGVAVDADAIPVHTHTHIHPDPPDSANEAAAAAAEAELVMTKANALKQHYSSLLYPTKLQCPVHSSISTSTPSTAAITTSSSSSSSTTGQGCVQVTFRNSEAISTLESVTASLKESPSAHLMIAIDEPAALRSLRELYWYPQWMLRHQGEDNYYSKVGTSRSGLSSHFRGSTGGSRSGSSSDMHFIIFLLTCCVLLVTILCLWNCVKYHYTRRDDLDLGVGGNDDISCCWYALSLSAHQKQQIYDWLTFAQRNKFSFDHKHYKSHSPESD